MAALKCKGPKVKTNFPISKYAVCVLRHNLSSTAASWPAVLLWHT